jgi:hypothetical protein
MTTMPHPTEEAFARFRRGELPPPEVARLGMHLANCRECAAAAARSVDVSRSAASLRDDLGEHLRGEAVVAYVDGTASTEETARATEHLGYCDACRRDVEDLRQFSRRAAITPSWWRLAAVAAAVLLAIVIAAAIIFRREPAAPPRTATHVDAHRAERDALVTAALRDGIAKPALLVSMTPPGQAMRGVSAGEEPRVIEPAGVVVDDARPLFRWSDTGNTNVSLSVFSEGQTVMQSATLRGNEWKPARALDRGKVYRWQIEVTTAKTVTIAPNPSDPPAMFAVLSDDEHRALAAARIRFANDDLYLGVLAARFGLESEAIGHLRRYCAAHPAEKQTAALLRSVESWRAAK